MTGVPQVNVADFDQEKECLYKGERYSVRNNGAVLRHQRAGKRRRALDEQWTFGNENTANPYLLVAGERIHRIVAIAFHGEPPEAQYVVDHIDSNCRNNRPENLRWLTRLENALNNPTTRKKIEYLCGSIDAFLENPSMLNDLQAGPIYSWMRTVTPEEAKNSLLRMSVWANTKKVSGAAGGRIENRRSFEKRVFRPIQKWEAGLAGEPGLEFASTPWCAKYWWECDVQFPCCPPVLGGDPLHDYFQQLITGSVFAYCEAGVLHTMPELTVAKAVVIDSESSIVVMCSRPDSLWSLVGIWLNERSHFVHFNLGSYRDPIDADRAWSKRWTPSEFWRVGYYGSPWEPSGIVIGKIGARGHQ